MILDPRPMGFIQWADQITLEIDKFGPTMRLDDIINWRLWAMNTLTLIGVSPASVNPFNFEDPVEWAIRFSQEAEQYLNA